MIWLVKKQDRNKIVLYRYWGNLFEPSCISGLNDNGEYPFPYYVSGTDSCKGDSGGPAYMWVDGKPILFGVVSR